MVRSRSAATARIRYAPLALAIGVLSSVILGLSVTGTLSSFTASITNSQNTANAGSLVMAETDSAGSVTCLSSSGTNNTYSTCTTINKYGGTTNLLTPGGAANVTTVRMYNTGNTAVNAFTLAPGACTTTGICGQLQLTLSCAPVTGGTVGTSVNLYNAIALSSLTTKDIKAASTTCVPATNGVAGSTTYVQFQFSVQLAAGADNTVQGQTASQPLTWTYTGV